MIICNGISLYRGKKQILSDTRLTARNGEITVLIGKNGSGKTSLLRCIAGVYKRFSGSITFDGVPAGSLSASRRAQTVAIMSQTLPLPRVTVKTLAEFGRQPYLRGGRLSENDRKAAIHAIKLAGIEAHCDDLVSELSGGERQIAFFSMLLAQNAPAVLLDEPTANLDAEYRSRVFSIIRSMRDAGKTIVMTLHNLDDAVELADNITVLHEGRTVFEGKPAGFITSDLPRMVFGLTPVTARDEAGEPFTVFRTNTAL